MADRIRKRSPGDAPAEGDRIPYVFVDIGNMSAKQFERVEDPQYAREHNLRLDLMYYWEHQIKKPMTGLFTILVDNADQLCSDMIREYIEQALQKNYTQKIPKSIRDYLTNEDQETKKKYDRDQLSRKRKIIKYTAQFGDDQEKIEEMIKADEEKKKKKDSMPKKIQRKRKTTDEDTRKIMAINKHFKPSNIDFKTIF